MDGAPEVDHAALIRPLQAPRRPLVVYTVHAGDELAARAVHDVVKGAGVRRAGVAAVAQTRLGDHAIPAHRMGTGQALQPSRIRSQAGRAFWASNMTGANDA